jgi:hypothetical protein
LLFILILSIKDGAIAVNYKLTAIHYGNQGWDMDQIRNLSLYGSVNIRQPLFFLLIGVIIP